MPGNGKVLPFTIEMAKRIYLSHLCWDMIELDQQYTHCQGCVLRSMARSHVTVREWFSEVTGTNFDVCCASWPQLPVALMERALYEIGLVVDRSSADPENLQRRTWKAPLGYEMFAEG